MRPIIDRGLGQYLGSLRLAWQSSARLGYRAFQLSQQHMQWKTTGPHPCRCGRRRHSTRAHYNIRTTALIECHRRHLCGCHVKQHLLAGISLRTSLQGMCWMCKLSIVSCVLCVFVGSCTCASQVMLDVTPVNTMWQAYQSPRARLEQSNC